MIKLFSCDKNSSFNGESSNLPIIDIKVFV